MTLPADRPDQLWAAAHDLVAHEAFRIAARREKRGPEGERAERGIFGLLAEQDAPFAARGRRRRIDQLEPQFRAV